MHIIYKNTREQTWNYWLAGVIPLKVDYTKVENIDTSTFDEKIAEQTEVSIWECISCCLQMYPSIQTLIHVQELKTERDYWEKLYHESIDLQKREKKKLEQEYKQVAYSPTSVQQRARNFLPSVKAVLRVQLWSLCHVLNWSVVDLVFWR